MINKIGHVRQSVVTHAFNPRIWKAEVGGLNLGMF